MRTQAERLKQYRGILERTAGGAAALHRSHSESDLPAGVPPRLPGSQTTDSAAQTQHRDTDSIDVSLLHTDGVIQRVIVRNVVCGNHCYQFLFTHSAATAAEATNGKVSIFCITTCHVMHHAPCVGGCQG